MHVTSWATSHEYADLTEATAQARLSYFRALGEPDKDVWSPTAVPLGGASVPGSTPSFRAAG